MAMASSAEARRVNSVALLDEALNPVESPIQYPRQFAEQDLLKLVVFLAQP